MSHLWSVKCITERIFRSNKNVYLDFSTTNIKNIETLQHKLRKSIFLISKKYNIKYNKNIHLVTWSLQNQKLHDIFFNTGPV
jgi:hypothetical protein